MLNADRVILQMVTTTGPLVTSQGLVHLILPITETVTTGYFIYYCAFSSHYSEFIDSLLHITMY